MKKLWESTEYRAKMKKAFSNRILTEEHKSNIGKAHLGLKYKKG